MEVYMDNNATTKVDKQVLNKMLPYFRDRFANPSAVYPIARLVRKDIENSRAKVAELINADNDEIIFTSGGTEANNTIVKGIAYSLKNKGKHIITTVIEHKSILNICKFLEVQGFEVTYLPVDKYGVMDIDILKKSIRKDTILITVMYVNNEVGSIQPIDEIVNIAKNNNIYVHTDAVQAIGKIRIDVRKLGVDFLSISGHKLYGPKGVGAVFIRRSSKFRPLLHGGGQEKYRRSGTENVPGIIGFGKACEIAIKNMDRYMSKIKLIRDYLKKELTSNFRDIRINSCDDKSLCTTLNVSFRNIDSNYIIKRLGQDGIYVSTGSACSAGLPEPSYVLKAMKVDDEFINGTVRFSLGKYNKMYDVKKVIKSLKKIIKR